jgi:peptide/nickel transport system substrate-binding protein
VKTRLLFSLLASSALLSGCIAPAPVKTNAGAPLAEQKGSIDTGVNTTVRYAGGDASSSTNASTDANASSGANASSAGSASSGSAIPAEKTHSAEISFLFPNPGPFKLVEKDGREYWQARGEVGQFGGAIKLGSFGGGPKTFNPWDASDVESHGIGMLQFDSLVDFDPWTGKAIPKLAKSYKVSADGRTIDFVMRKGLKWSDGHPLTADDAVFTYGTIIKDGFGETSGRDTISTPDDYPTVVKVGEDTVSFRFKKPFSPFLANLNAVMVAPKHIFEPLTKGSKAQFHNFWNINSDPKTFVGSGPMIVERYIPGQRLEFRRNPHYSFIDKEGRQLPYLDKMIIGIVPDQNTMIIKFLGDEIDLLDTRSVRGIDAALLKQREASNNFTMYNLGPDDGTMFLMFNLCQRNDPKTGKPYVKKAQQEWFNNEKFRWAISHSIDRKRIINNVQKGVGYPLSTNETEASLYFNKKLKPIEYDHLKAVALLKEAGFVKKGNDLYDAKGNLVEFDLITNSGNTGRDACCITIKEELKKLGIKVNYQPIEFNTMTNRVHTSLDWQAIVMGLSGSRFEPYGGANVWKSDGRMHMFDTRLPDKNGLVKAPDARPWEKEIDRLLDTAAGTMDETKRRQCYDRFQEIAYEKQPFIYIYDIMLLTAAHNNIGNYKPSPYGIYYTPKGTLHNLEEIYIKGAKH